MDSEMEVQRLPIFKEISAKNKRLPIFKEISAKKNKSTLNVKAMPFISKNRN